MARDFQSYIFNRGVTPNTLSVISSKNRVLAVNAKGGPNPTQIGVVSTFDPSETRTIEPVRGIGFGDYIAELVPGVTDPMSLAVTRTALYISMIYQVFGYKGGVDGFVRSLKHHRWPFDIRQEVVFSTLATQLLAGDSASNAVLAPQNPNDDDTIVAESSSVNASAIITLYEACWISDYSVSFASDTALVQETVTIMTTDVIANETVRSTTQGPGFVDSISQDAISKRLLTTAA